MQIEAKKLNLDYLYEKEIQKFFLNPAYHMVTDVILEYLKNYLEAAELTSKLLTKEKRNLSDETFLYYLTRISDVILSPQNEINILNKTYQKDYQQFATILTTMSEKYIIEGSIREYLIGYNVIVAENIFLDERLYSKKEIRKLVNNHDILIYDGFEARYEGAKFASESYEYFPIINLENFLNNKLEIRNNTMKYIRKKASNAKIEQVLYEYLINLQKLVKEIISKKDKFLFEQRFSDQCRREFNKTGQIKKLERLLENYKTP